VRRREIVTFLSDYGLEDEFVGVCHGVMLMIAPNLQIVDLNHNIFRQDIRHGAVVLEQTIHFLPESVHLAVVDPTVGAGRRAIAIETYGGHTFVGPDNGLLMPAVETVGGIQTAVEISDERAARQVLQFVERLDDLDDVQNVYANFDIPSDVLESVAS
jgi:S-adenosylmethionine hydrolase